MLNGMLSKRHGLTRVTALASLQGLNVRAFLRGRGQRCAVSRQSSAISSPLQELLLPDATSVLPLS